MHRAALYSGLPPSVTHAESIWLGCMSAYNASHTAAGTGATWRTISEPRGTPLVCLSSVPPDLDEQPSLRDK
jgi:hypothetical protein